MGMVMKKQCQPKPMALLPAIIIGMTTVKPVLSSEFDILAENEPKTSYYIDDAAVLSRTTRNEIDSKLSALESDLGYKLTLVTTRKLEFDPDGFTFSDKIFSKWH